MKARTSQILGWWKKCLNNCSYEAYSYAKDDESGCEIRSRDSSKICGHCYNLTAGWCQIHFLVARKNGECIYYNNPPTSMITMVINIAVLQMYMFVKSV